MTDDASTSESRDTTRPPTPIRLGQLFECFEIGIGPYAEDAVGNLKHVDDVPSGLACRCKCPGCERDVVAKKGSRAHHFAHRARINGMTCTSPGETALHKFAKRILDERLEITLPALAVRQDEDIETVVASGRRTFDGADLEKREGEIVPDVVLHLKDRSLIIEFMVTHSCDERKIARIREMDVGAVEIDLSSYRNHTLEDIVEPILHEAPRTWLHNPKEQSARDRLRARAEERAAERRDLISKTGKAYRHRLPSKIPGNGAWENAARLDGLGEILNLPVKGTGSISAPVAEWQAAIVLTLVKDMPEPFRTRTGLEVLRSQNWLDRQFLSLQNDIVDGIKKEVLTFDTPINAISNYLRELSKLGFVHSSRTEIWDPTPSLLTKIEDAREIRERPLRRRDEIRIIIDGILGDLPVGETASFRFEQWWLRKLPNQPYSPKEAADFAETHWQKFKHNLTNITTNIRFQARENTDLMGLPLGKKLKDALDRKQKEAEERERAEQTRQEEVRANRISSLRNRAIDDLGLAANDWLTAPNSQLDGRTPLDAASDEDGRTRAGRALDGHVRELEAEERARRIREKALQTLRTAAQEKYYGEDRARLWLTTGRTELGGKSPEEYTVDELTCGKCLSYLPNKKSKR